MTRAILCDIEGTVGPIAFVREVLFPYAARELPDFVRENRERPAVRTQLEAVARQAGVDPGDTERLVLQLQKWIEQDAKVTPLKALQGMVWVRGYESGDFRAPVYEDAHRRLREWRARGFGLHIYSSGSVEAQKLYFRYSDRGDLRPLFQGWFDTNVGPKREASAYAAIADILGAVPEDILFLSDSAAELDAAAAARLRTTWVIRPEDSDVAIAEVRSRHPLAASFDDIHP